MILDLDDSVPTVDQITVHTKVGNHVHNNLLHEIMSPFASIEAPNPASGHIFIPVKLQAVPAVDQVAVQGEVFNDVLDDLLHEKKSPFISIEARSPAPGHFYLRRSLISDRCTQQNPRGIQRWSCTLRQTASSCSCISFSRAGGPVILACFILACQSTPAPDPAAFSGDAAAPRRWDVS
jgi:hypothetical protein